MLAFLAAANAQPAIIAHRGFSAIAPENTMAAFARAAEQGFGFELDVTLSRDGKVVVLHDDTLDRTTTGTGSPSSLTAEELSRLDAGSWFGPAFIGEPMPTLRAVLERFGGQVPIDIELKSLKPREPFAEAVVRVIREAGVVDDVVVTSFDPYLLEAVKHIEPRLRRGQLTSRFKGSKLSPVAKFFLRHMLLNKRSSPGFVALEHSLIRERRVRRLHRRGYAVWCWTVNEPEDMTRVIEAGVDAIITDHPDRLKTLLASRH